MAKAAEFYFKYLQTNIFDADPLVAQLAASLTANGKAFSVRAIIPFQLFPSLIL